MTAHQHKLSSVYGYLHALYRYGLHNV